MIKGNPISTLWNSTFVFDASGENTIITHSRYAMVIVYTCINTANDHGYFPFVVITIQSFPHSWLIMGFVTRVIRRVPLVEQELLTVLGHLSSPSVLSGFLCMFTIVILYLSVEIQLSKRKGVEILFDRFHTATLLYLSQAETLISTSYVIFVFWMVWGGIWILIFVILLVDNHCLNCLFIKLKIRHQQHIPIYLPLSFWWSVNLICLSWSNSCDKASNYKKKKTTLNIEKKYYFICSVWCLHAKNIFTNYSLNINTVIAFLIYTLLLK